MSAKLIDTEVQRFLSTDMPEVICIRGKWGIGKTYSWGEYLRQARDAKKIALSRYAYVSLFGINTIDELKYAIFENTVPKERAGGLADINSFRSLAESAEMIGRKGALFAKAIPWVQSSFGAASPVLFLTIRNQTICIDDLERKGSKLAVDDVLGLISFLKEQRSCKVCLLLNDEALVGDSKEKFETYLEKVVDVSLRFAPTVSESIEIALKENPRVRELISGHCEILGICNIRVIKKIERFVSAVEPLLNTYHARVMAQAAQTLTLFGWSILEPSVAPDIEFLKNWNMFASRNAQENNAEFSRWGSVLDNLGFTIVDEFDLTLLKAVRDGLFDSDAVKRAAYALHQKCEAEAADATFTGAWEIYHDSFDNNQDEVVASIYGSFRQNIRVISPMNLNGTVSLLKELGEQVKALELIALYVEQRGDDRELFDLANYSFGNRVTDGDIRTAFDAKFTNYPDDRDPKDILLAFSKDHAVRNEDVTRLARMSADDFYDLFKQNRAGDLRRIIDAALQLGRDDVMQLGRDDVLPRQRIGEQVRLALMRIGQESSINARRVSRYGIMIPE